MTRTPPAPIMDSEIPTKGHDWLPGWITKWWDEPDAQGQQRPTFQAGEGMVRRPDVVIVNDPTKPPTQDNIKQVVEIKFPPDDLSNAQQKAYEDIAGGQDKFAKLELTTATATSPIQTRPEYRLPTRRRYRPRPWQQC